MLYLFSNLAVKLMCVTTEASVFYLDCLLFQKKILFHFIYNRVRDELSNAQVVDVGADQGEGTLKTHMY